MDPEYTTINLIIPPRSPIPEIKFFLPETNEVQHYIYTPQRKERRVRSDKGPYQGRRKHPNASSTSDNNAGIFDIQGDSLDSSLPSTPLQETDIYDQVDYNTFDHYSPVSQANGLTHGNGPFNKTTEVDPYQYFVEAVFSEECGVYQLSQSIFLVNGWNSTRKTITTQWYHLQRIRLGETHEFACMCPGDGSMTCFHIIFLREFGAERFPHDEIGNLELNDQSFLVTRFQELTEDVYTNIFSIPANHLPTIKNRAVVHYTGSDDGTGTWTCNKDPCIINCSHVEKARHVLQQHVRADINARDPSSTEKMTYQEPSVRRATASTNESVSHMPVPPLAWAHISSDLDLGPIRHLNSAPDLIFLEGNNSSCCCQSNCSEYNPFSDTITKSCLIYGLTSCWESKIQLQNCTLCKHRYIGPYCRRLGLFNWNNRILLTHHLLDDYTSAFTSSETPFSSWVFVLSRRYEAVSPGGIPFLSEKIFCSAWFSYTRLIQFGDDMKCLHCGPTPKAVIFDDVSLAFNQKNITSFLAPPTIIHPESTIRDHTVRVKRLQIIPDAVTRKQICNIVVGPPLNITNSTSSTTSSIDLNDDITEESGSSEEEDIRQRNNSRRLVAVQAKQKALRDRFQLIPDTVQALKIINLDLGTLFDTYFGVSSVLQGSPAPQVYQKLFIQISAEENALQMINRPGLEHLRLFLQKKDQASASFLITIPALYNVIQHEFQIYKHILPTTFGVCSWLYVRGETVRRMLLHHMTDPADLSINEKSIHWAKTGCIYGMPQIRHRPQYPKLKEGERVDSGKESRNGCRKYYSRYSPKKLTGGIMVAWCTHSVSYGFHCIPIGEGRNDVFSALYTRWEKAPEIIVYDFACALQPYCVLREPDFFQDTLFTIDAFHAPDHTKCCPSAFLTTYCETDPRLLSLNSSAAECGNGGLARMRKSVSYMGQDRAVIYTKVFLCIWNRLRIRRMQAALSK